MIPLVVVIYRVLMVCHVDFCMRHGEKIIRDKLFRWKAVTHVFSVLNKYALVMYVQYSAVH